VLLYTVHTVDEQLAEMPMDAQRQLRKTLNFSLPADLEKYIKEKAERAHGGNVSRYLRTLIVEDAKRDESVRERDAQEMSVA
jgi:hypothetical protein